MAPGSAHVDEAGHTGLLKVWSGGICGAGVLGGVGLVPRGVCGEIGTIGRGMWYVENRFGPPVLFVRSQVSWNSRSACPFLDVLASLRTKEL